MAGKIHSITSAVLKKINPDDEEIKKVSNHARKFSNLLESSIKKNKIKAEVFVGGSVAKETIIKSERYDIDLFIRFIDEKEDMKVSQMTEKILRELVKPSDLRRVKGSRDYFSIEIEKNIVIEVIPVVKISRPENSNNVTDLSYFHVNYVKKKIKNKKLRDEIRLIKAFCQAQKCYGAEGYIKGFSGYSLELLAIYYKSFEKFIKAIASNSPSNDKKKIIIDIEKKFKNKQDIFMDINSSKLQSPIILIDPTYKQRNALAGLSEETFSSFKEVCQKFLKKPDVSYFTEKKKDINKVREKATANGYEFILIEAHTDRQEGDIAGTKLFKFYNFLSKEIEKYFKIKDRGFNYNNQKAARYYLVAKGKKEIIFRGPKAKDKSNGSEFKKAHGKTEEKNGILYARERIDFTINEFINEWKNKNKTQMNEMGITSLRIIEDIID